MIFDFWLQNAQGETPVVLETGGGSSLVSREVPLNLPSMGAGVKLQFQFGFSTAETAGPGKFLDSFLVSLAGAGGPHYLPLVTVDSMAPVWVPAGGTVPFSELELGRTAIAYPEGVPVYGSQSAWQVSLLIPEGLLTDPNLFLYFDLFDNGDPTHSLGWFNEVKTEAVPEPSTVTLGISAAIALFLSRKSKKQS